MHVFFKFIWNINILKFNYLYYLCVKESRLCFAFKRLSAVEEFLLKLAYMIESLGFLVNDKSKA
jgi:hypothetical protein